MLKRSVSFGTCFLAILLAPCEGTSQATSKSLDRLRAIDRSAKLPWVSRVASGSSHTVANGETLWGISRKYKVSFAELASLNALPAENPVIKIGQKLRIPVAKKKPASPKKPTSFRKHQVGKGETFYRIARKHGVSVSALKKANTSINPSALKIGTTLQIPSYGKVTPKPVETPPAPKPPVKKETPKVTPPPPPAPAPIQRSQAPKDRAHLAPPGFGIYTAQPGDTAASIAKQYGISREEFLRINKKSSYPNYAPRPGEFLMVPTDGSWYVPNQTPQQAPSVRRVNTLAAPPSNALRGTRRTAPAQPGKKMLVVHEIRANDSLEALARRFGTTTDQILLDNPGIKGNRDLVVSKTLKIRTPSGL